MTLSLAHNYWWPNIICDVPAKTGDCMACTEIGKFLKTATLRSKWSPLFNSYEPYGEIKIDFSGPITEKGNNFFLSAIDRYSKYLSVETFNNASAANLIKFLDQNFFKNKVPRAIRLDQAEQN